MILEHLSINFQQHLSHFISIFLSHKLIHKLLYDNTTRNSLFTTPLYLNVLVHSKTEFSVTKDNRDQIINTPKSVSKSVYKISR